MTRDEIISIARKHDVIDFRDDNREGHVVDLVDFLESLVQIAIGREIAIRSGLVDAEREACAKLCESLTETGAHIRCAAAIRARGNQ